MDWVNVMLTMFGLLGVFLIGYFVGCEVTAKKIKETIDGMLKSVKKGVEN